MQPLHFSTSFAPNLKSYASLRGGARGGDAIGRAWAMARGIEVVTYFADWSLQGRKAGPLRNIRMLEDGKPTLVVALPGGKGTAHMISIARVAGVPVAEMEKQD